MMLTELTIVPPEVLPIEGFKAHLKLGSGFTDDGVQDDVLDGYLRAALAAIEARTGKVLIARDFTWTTSGWRNDTRQPLPLAPVTTLSQIVLRQAMGDDILIPMSQYALEEDSQRPAIVATGACLPTIPRGGSIRVDFTAGFGATWSDVPPDLRQAVYMLAAHFYEYRHEVALNGSTMPYGVSALIERYRTVRLFMGAGQ